MNYREKQQNSKMQSRLLDYPVTELDEYEQQLKIEK